VITSEESSEEMGATNLEATPEETEAAVERLDLFKRRRYRVIGGQVRRTTLGYATSPRGKEAVPGRRCLMPASESYAASSLQFEKEIFARFQARTVLRGEPLREGGS
jgi:hypothetical protein